MIANTWYRFHVKQLTNILIWTIYKQCWYEVKFNLMWYSVLCPLLKTLSLSLKFTYSIIKFNFAHRNDRIYFVFVWTLLSVLGVCFVPVGWFVNMCVSLFAIYFKVNRCKATEFSCVKCSLFHRLNQRIKLSCYSYRKINSRKIWLFLKVGPFGEVFALCCSSKNRGLCAIQLVRCFIYARSSKCLY